MKRAFSQGFMNGMVLMVLMGEFTAKNARGLLFTIGSAWLYHGVAGFSPSAANVVAGLILMAIGAVPYLLRLKGKR